MIKLEKLTSDNEAQLNELNKLKALIQQRKFEEPEIKKELAASHQANDELKKMMSAKNEEMEKLKIKFDEMAINFVK